MDKNPFSKREKYYPLIIKNKIKYDNNRKNHDSYIKSSKKIEKMMYFLSDKKERNSFTFFKTFIENNGDMSNEIINKKLIKVKTDNKSKPKNSKYNPGCIANNGRRSNPKIKTKFNINIKDSDASMTQKINKFESRIDNLLNVINDFEKKFIYSPETKKIKEELNGIINKKIYQDKIANNYLCRSYNKNEIKNKIDIFVNNSVNRKERKDNYIMDINNLNININNNNFENNYYITNPIKDKSHKIINKKQNFSENYKKNIYINNNAIKKSKIKQKKKLSKINSNDLKNKSIQNYKKKKNIFKLPLESIKNNIAFNKNTIKNNRYNYSYKEFQIPLTERKEKDIDDIKINETNDLRNSIKNINKKKNTCIRINKAVSSKNEIRRKTFIKKDENNNKLNSFKKKKKFLDKNLTPSSSQGNYYINNTINGRIVKGHKIGNNKNKDKEKSVNGSAELLKMRKKDSTDFIYYILNKRNILKNNKILSSGNIQYVNKDFNYIKKLFSKKK